jgi:hypothetical protein
MRLTFAMRSRTRRLLAGLLVMAAACSGCGSPGASPEPLGVMFSAPRPGMRGGRYLQQRVQQVPGSFIPSRRGSRASALADPNAKVAAPLLELARRQPGARESVIVLLEDPIPMPWLAGASRSTFPWRPTSPHQTLLHRLISQRDSIDDRWLASLPQSWQVHEVGRAWVSQAISVILPAAIAESLASDSRVRSVEPRFRRVTLPMGCRILPPGGGRRPTCGPPLQDPPNASTWTFDRIAEMTHLGDYLALGLKSGRIAIFDTGIDQGHILFDPSPNLQRCLDCVAGDADCNGGQPGDIDVVDAGHGTKSASVLSAGCAYGAAYRGLANGAVDVMRVYRASGGSAGDSISGETEAELDLQAVWKAIQVSQRDPSDDILVFETQLRDLDSPTLDDYARNAFLSGAVVIAANGNYRDQPVGSPARAPGVMGIGFYSILAPQNGPGAHSQGRINGRFKPELLAPSNYMAAARLPNRRTSLDYFGWTSAATPVGAAAAATLLSWMHDIRWWPWNRFTPIPPGQVYAQMILSGDTPWSPGAQDGFTVDRGAGYLSMPVDGVGCWGSVVLGASDEPLPIPLVIPRGGARRVDASLWWYDPDEPLAEVTDRSFRSDFDLTILPPKGSGIPPGVSVSQGGVFERATAGSDDPGVAPLPGGWTLLIKCVRARGGPRVVYWAANAR